MNRLYLSKTNFANTMELSTLLHIKVSKLIVFFATETSVIKSNSNILFSPCIHKKYQANKCN